MAVITCLIWSFSYVHIIWMADSTDAVQMVIGRNYFAVPVLIVLWIIRRPDIRRFTRRQWLLVLAVAAFSGPVYHLPLHWGGDSGRTQASLIGLIIATVPVHVGWLAWIALGERMTLPRIIGLLLGIGGIFVVLSGHEHIDLTPKDLAGPLAVTLAAVVAAVNTVITRSARSSIAPIDLACVASSIAVVWYLVATPFASMEVMFDMPARGWWSAFYLGFFGIGVAYICWYTALSGNLPAASVAMYLFIPCVLSALWAWLWQDNQIGPAFFVGAGMVFLGLLTGAHASRGNYPRAQPVAPARAPQVEDQA